MTKIVVAVDGSESSQEALRWAVAEAKLHGQPLEVVMAWGYLDQHHVPAEASWFEPHYDDADAHEALAQYVAEVLGPDVPADLELRAICDLPGRALLDAGKDASMLVVGARGLGGFKRLLLGSVSQKVLHHATFPVAVVRALHEPTPSVGDGRIVVGVDGSRNADAALRWAIEEGRLRDASVEVVHAWRLPFVAPYPSIAADLDSTIFDDEARKTLDEAIRRAKPGPEDRVSRLTSLSGPSSLILETAKGADLIVVGSRGLSGAKAAVLGSVSHQVTLHAACPVVVIPEDPT